MQRQATSDKQPTIQSQLTPFFLFLVACHLLLASGCVRRSLTIRSEPEGARVLVNNFNAGTTPLKFDFTWYGNYNFLLSKDGYENLHAREKIKAPVYLWIPFDLIMEILPFPIRDDRQLVYTLDPRPQPQEPAVPLPPSQAEEVTEDPKGSNIVE
jgi:hypothetical protein